MKKFLLLLSLFFANLGYTADHPKSDYHIFKSEISSEDLTWLIKNIYFEARNQPTAGRIAVMMVTLNRVASDKFPNTIKEVVTQGGTKRDQCQFSWYCDGIPDKVHDWKTYNDLVTLVLTFLPVASKITDVTDGATFYHNHTVKPKWAKTMKVTAVIDDHIFYKN